MNFGFVRVDQLKAKYRVIYLTPIFLALLGSVIASVIDTFSLIDLLGMATETRGDKAIVGFVLLLNWCVLFFAIAAATVGAMILFGKISISEGWLMLSGQGVPSHWYRA